MAGLGIPDAMRHRAFMVFAATGAVWGTWAGRLPAIQAQLGLRPSQLSLVALAIEGGAIAALPVGGALVTRWGSRGCLAVAFATYAGALAATAWAPSLGVLAVVVSVMAAANSVVDVASNAQGVALERRVARPLLPSLHGAHSLGVAAGGGAAVAAAAAGLGPRMHFAALAAVMGTAAIVAALRLPGGRPPRARRGLRPTRGLLAVGLLAFCALLVEGSADTWSAVLLRDRLQAPDWLAAGAFTGFALALAAGRAATGPLVAWLGRSRLVRTAGAASAALVVLVVVAPTPWLSAAGFTGLGLAIAGVTPIAFAAAPGATSAPPAVAIATATTIGYLGTFSGPPAIGAIGLPAGLLLAVPAALGIVALGGAVRPSRPSPPAPRRARRGRRR